MILDALFDFGGRNLGKAGPDGDLLTTSNNVVDLTQVRNVGAGQGLIPQVRFTVSTTFTVGGGTPRLYPSIVYADNETLTSNVTVVSMVGGSGFALLPTTPATGVPGGLLATSLQAGRSFYLPLPGVSTVVSGKAAPAHRQRYVGVVFWQFAYEGNYFSAGRMDAELVLDAPFEHVTEDATFPWPDATN